MQRIQTALENQGTRDQIHKVSLALSRWELLVAISTCIKRHRAIDPITTGEGAATIGWNLGPGIEVPLKQERLKYLQ
jgi:hypothetical protein